MSRKDFLTTAIATMLAAASNDIYGVPSGGVSRRVVNESERKKCKSCMHFNKESGTRCSCRIGARAYGVNPLDSACKEYRKRRK